MVLAAANAAALVSERHFARIPDFQVARHVQGRRLTNLHRSAHTSIAQANRWTGKPHEHRREIARRLRQQGRV
jgi:hypothetical protein